MFILKKGVLCPQCERGKLGVLKKTLIFTYKDRSKKFPNEKLFKCNVCDYEGLTHNDNERIDKILADFRRSIDNLLSCNQLQSIRKELGLNKKQMAKVLSVNEKTIGRYENGKVTQSNHMDKLYRVLQAFPSAARIIEPNSKVESANFHFDYNPKPINKYVLVADDYLDHREYAHAT